MQIMTEEIINKETLDQYVSDAVDLLKKLIATPSVSRDEKAAADILEDTIRSYGFEPERIGNNIIVQSPPLREGAGGRFLLNAHIDTVK
ncbi:MAG: hypothetical protein IKO28_06645, partial [Prevotella sp.]|nr:hypothetical protein [Prevotella sp.]